MEVLRLVWHFVLHIFFGTLIFCLFGVAAVCLHLFVRWVEQQGLIWPAVYGLHLLNISFLFSMVLPIFILLSEFFGNLSEKSRSKPHETRL